ncbi:TraR/DksA C4-type zinc finger protein [Streptomyces sp. NPDC048290]|uniref:TraR/DksA family transcriptional regulator n=1 Tax=Streptomyces sp. NPDC048290 TaxID=3155811 RepID=UPI003448FF07
MSGSPEPRKGSRAAGPGVHEARLRLDHARTSRLAQLHALDGTDRDAADPLMAVQAEAVRRVLTEIDEAFARVEDGSYGRCVGCAKPVAAERLEILPYTRYCVTCQRHAAG